MSKSGCQVITALIGQEVLKKLESEGPVDIVFTDLGMPEMTGWELTEQLKILHRHLPVVLITGWGFQPKEEESEEKVDFVLPKPFKTNEITRLISQIVGRKTEAPAASCRESTTVKDFYLILDSLANPAASCGVSERSFGSIIKSEYD